MKIDKYKIPYYSEEYVVFGGGDWKYGLFDRRYAW